MPEEKPFNDFFLLGLSHLSPFEANAFPLPRALEENQKRLEYGKKAIRENTVKGDLIAFESPEVSTFEHYKKLLEAKRGKKITSSFEKKTVLQQWQNRYRALQNLYADLARYAESIGRKTVSLEPTIRKPASALLLAYCKQPFHTERKKRMYYLLEEKTNISFTKRIQRIRPKTVIVSLPHAAVIEAKLKPTRIDYFPRATKRLRKRYSRETIKGMRLHKTKKMARLATARAAKRKPRMK